MLAHIKNQLRARRLASAVRRDDQEQTIRLLLETSFFVPVCASEPIVHDASDAEMLEQVESIAQHLSEEDTMRPMVIRDGDYPYTPVFTTRRKITPFLSRLVRKSDSMIGVGAVRVLGAYIPSSTPSGVTIIVNKDSRGEYSMPNIVTESIREAAHELQSPA